jgi:uncharacterized membrane protein YfcA
MPAAAFLLIGFAAGISSGLFGIGGGIIIVVALTSLMKMPIHIANGTSLAALLLPVSIGAVYKYWQAGHVNINAAMLIAGGILVGGFVGAKYAQGLTPLALQRAFAVFLLVMAVRTWLKASA